MTATLSLRAGGTTAPRGPTRLPNWRLAHSVVAATASAILVAVALSIFWIAYGSPTRPEPHLASSDQVIAPIKANLVHDGTLKLEEVEDEPQPGDPYIENCRANDVPIPPDWPDERWIRRGDLPFVFAEFPDARSNEVFTYEEPNGGGICYAFVRKNHNNWYEAVGIICQSRATGKACFWDNVIPGERTDARIRGLEIKLDIRKIGNGSNMRERCTDCHRGADVFLIHPGTPLDAVKHRVPDVRYTPLGQSDWENPPPFEELGEGACSQCHELASPTKRFCGLLRQAAEKTMPSRARPAGWENPLPEYRAAIEKLKARCAPLLD